MKYMLLIHQGDCHHRTGAGRQDADHRRAVRRHQGGAGRLPPLRGRRPRRGDRARVAHSGGPHGRRGGGAPDRGVVVYLIFNEGYGGRGDLAAEAIRLGRALAELMPDEPEVQGLLALMLVNDARRDARFADGTVVLLRDQDRSLWDFDQIAEGRAALERALALGGRDPYVLQAAIAALHVDEPQDWPQLAALYGELARLTGSPVVELNRAVAIAEAGEVEAALALVERLELDRYHCAALAERAPRPALRTPAGCGRRGRARRTARPRSAAPRPRRCGLAEGSGSGCGGRAP